MSSQVRLLKLGFQRHAPTATNPLSFQAYSTPLPSTACAPRPLLDPFALSSAARAADDLLLVRALHTLAVIYGLHADVVVATAILDAYCKCGDVYSSRKLFDSMPHRNVVSWNAMIAGYANAGMGVSALELFRQMRCAEFRLRVDEYTVASGLTACAVISDVGSGAQIHAYAMRAGFETDHAVASALATMYYRCWDVEGAQRAMEGRENCSLSSQLMMIKGYVANGRYSDALEFVVGYASDDLVALIMMDRSILVSILTACAHLVLVKVGKQVHGHIVTAQHSVCNGYNAVVWSVLIDMYCKCSNVIDARSVFDSLQERPIVCWNSMITGYIRNGLLEEARELFHKLPSKNVISWTAMISGYVQQGMPQEGLRLLASLYNEGGGGLVRGNCFTFAIALDACSCLTALVTGKQIHAQALRTSIQDGHNSVIVVETALVDMYSKSGNLKYARRVFDSMGKKNIVSWTTMISGYAAHGSGLEAIKVFEQMISLGLEPNEVTFVAVLSACSRCGLVSQATHYLKLMTERYGVMPTEEHYTCIIDVLGRAGKLVEAWKLLEELKGEGKHYDGDGDLENGEHASLWGALLGGCSLHGEVEIASKVANKMLASKQQISYSYVALSNIYAASDRWDEVYRVRKESKKQGVGKEPGQSQIQVGAPT